MSVFKTTEAPAFDAANHRSGIDSRLYVRSSGRLRYRHQNISQRRRIPLAGVCNMVLMAQYRSSLPLENVLLLDVLTARR